MSAAPDLSSALMLQLSEIRLDGGTQSRALLSDDTIADYAEKYAEGVAMPPAVVFYDGESYWLADGFHRCAGAKKAGKTSIVAQVRQGSQRDAILFSVGANDSHGLRRTNADKRRAVEMLLRDEEWSKKSDRWIAETCAVAASFVGDMRRREPNCSPTTVDERLGQDGKTRKMPERQPAAGRFEPDVVFTDGEGVLSKMHERAREFEREAELQNAAPDPKLWWVCPMSGCGQEYNRAAAAKHGWIKRGFCEDCEAAPAPEEAEEGPVAPPPERAKLGELLGIVRLEDLERIAAQRNADPDFAGLRQTQRAIGQALPSRSQRMLDFILDGGELSLIRLGLDWTATLESLQQAYREKSRTAHPDRGGSQAAFVALTRDREMVKTMLGGVE